MPIRTGSRSISYQCKIIWLVFAGVVIHAGHEQQRQASLPSSVVRLRVTDIPATLPPIPAKAVRPCVA
jgi:hypothetical protein